MLITAAIVKRHPDFQAFDTHGAALTLALTACKTDGVGALPGGTVTFMMTDIESSSLLWEADAATMRAAMSVHDQIVAEVIAAHDGVIVKHLGDGCLVHQRRLKLIERDRSERQAHRFRRPAVINTASTTMSASTP
jgi:class 3 adenylate cyclase